MSIRRILNDEKGNSPYVVIAGVIVFLAVGVGLATALSLGLTTSATLKVNAGLADAASTNVQLLAVQGYDVVAALPASAPVELTIGEATTDAIRAVEVNATSRTARITLAVGRYRDGGFASSDLCAEDPEKCVIVTELVTGAGLAAP